ncbi:unnamed protein product [Lampetra planeri]
MSSASLPPVGNLPHWSRVTSLDRAHYPRPVDGERPVHRLNVQPAPVEGITLAVGSGGWDRKGSGDVRSESGAGSSRSEHGKATATGGVEASSLAGRRILQLERSLEFVQKEHADMLQRLHAEVDRLTRENKDLQFMLIVNQRELHSSEAQQTSSPMLLVQAGKGGLAPVKTSFGLAGPASILEFQQLVRRLQKVNQQQADELLQLKTKLRNAAIADRLPANSVLVAKPLFSSRSNEQWPPRTEPKLSLPSLVQPLRREVAQDGREKDSQKMLPS